MPHVLALFALAYNPLDSAYVVPVAGCIMILGIVLGGIWSGVRTEEIRSRERLECIARGITPPPTPEELALSAAGKQSRVDSMTRRRANIRLAGVVLLCASLGLMVFFVTLSIVLHIREVLAGAASSLIPLGIGVGFLVDTRLQSYEIEQRAAGVDSAK